MIKISFNKIDFKKQFEKKAREAMKKDFKSKINQIARPFGETPRIRFIDQGGLRFSAEVKVTSAELREKIDEFLKQR